MRKQKWSLLGVLAFFVVTLSACNLLPNRPEVDTLTERLGEAYVGIAAAYNTTAQALEREDITVDTAENIQSRLQDAEQTARTVSEMISAGGDPAQQLGVLEETLTAIQRRVKQETINE
mgnify:CR=1 FL=1